MVPPMEVQRHAGESPYEELYGFSRALRVDDRIIVSGTAPVPAPGSELALTASAQMERCVEIAREAIESLGGTMGDVVRTRMFIVDAEDADAVGRVHALAFGEAAPAATMVVVAGLLDSRWRVEIEVEAIV